MPSTLHSLRDIARCTDIIINTSLILNLPFRVGHIADGKERNKHIPVEVSHDGTCRWEPGQQHYSYCPVDIQMYPFDTQTCKLQFSPWVYTEDLINLTMADDAKYCLTASTVSNVEWDIVGHRTYNRKLRYYCSPRFYSSVVFEVHLKRKPLFYVVNILLPSAMLAALVLLLFCLPPESGEKMSMALTLLLAYSVLMVLVSENVPRSSHSVPFIGK